MNMEFALTPEQKLIKQTAREFADEKLAPLAAEYDRSEEFTAPQAKMLAEMGFLGMMVPEEYGGSGLDTISYVLAMEEVSRACASTSVTMTVQNSLVCWPARSILATRSKSASSCATCEGRNTRLLWSLRACQPVPTRLQWQPRQLKTATTMS